MRKTTRKLLLKTSLLILILFSLPAAAQKVDRDIVYDYSENVEFKVLTLNKQKVLDRSNSNYTRTIVAEKGRRFVTIIFEFKNKSFEPQEIDFDKFYIIDKNMELHKIDFVIMAMKFTGRFDKLQQKLKANKKRKIIVQFRPSFGKDELINEIMIDKKVIKLKYK